MKKLVIWSLILAIFASVLLTGCAEQESLSTEPTETEATQPTTVPTEPTTAPTDVPTEAPTEAPTGAPTEAPTEAPTQVPTQKPTQAPTQKPTQAPTQAPTQKPTQAPTQKPTEQGHIHDYTYKYVYSDHLCTEEGYVHHYCACGAFQVWIRMPKTHALRYNVITEATHDKEGLQEITCSTCSYAVREKIPKVNVPYLVGLELVSEVRPNDEFLSDGTPIFKKIYGDEYCQVGDVFTYRVVMSDGGTTGFEIERMDGGDNIADVTVDGNLVTLTIKQLPPSAPNYFFAVHSNDIDNKPVRRVVEKQIVGDNLKFSDFSRESGSVVLGDYINKQGMSTALLYLNYFNDGILTSYTNGDPSLSISGTAKYGHDDYIVVAEHEDWLDMYFDLIDEYKSRGFTKVYMFYSGEDIALRAC